MELGNALETILSGLANMVAQEALKYTMLSGKLPLPPHSSGPHSQPFQFPLWVPEALTNQALC